ncbi:ATP-dependent DNA helicase PIF1-like protein [Tanacetum coccineum]
MGSGCRLWQSACQNQRGEDEPTWIKIPENFRINTSNSLIEQIVAETYPNFIERQKDDAYLRERAILTPRNDDADAINAYMFDKLEGESVTYNSADEICKASTNTLDQQHLYPIEFLNTLNFPGMSPPRLNLIKGTPHKCYCDFVIRGQSLNYVGLYLPNPLFSHGQLYVALSRVTNPEGLKILMTEDGDKELKNFTRNIVYKEAFNYLT